MEVGVNEFLDGLVAAADVGTQGGVVVRAQLSNDTVDHSWAEHVVLLIHCTLLLEAVGTCYAAVGELSEAIEAVLVLLVVDVNVNISLLGNLKSILHLKAVAACYAQASE